MIIEYCSKLYPQKLREINNPPSRLYVKGNLEILKNYGIAIIGSRTNTQYGEKMCKTFTKKLVEYNINIISGLAVGIDSIAHKTCLKNNGKTIAVLPCGFKNIYPEINKPLAQEIIKNEGLLISEYEENIKPDSKKFKERNRIVSGLAIGTLVVEAGYRSGTTITARETKKQGKPVFCIPSSLENTKGIATNDLIKKGSKIVTNIKDILDTYKDIKFTQTKKEIIKNNFDISKELIDIYKIIDNVPKDINELVIKTGLSISEINYKTMMLEMENKITQLPGQRFIKKEEE